jgi:hypothetical protein
LSEFLLVDRKADCEEEDHDEDRRYYYVYLYMKKIGDPGRKRKKRG